MTNEKKKKCRSYCGYSAKFNSYCEFVCSFIYKDIHINHSIQISNPFPPLSLSQSQSHSFTLKTNDDVTLSHSQNQRWCRSLSLSLCEPTVLHSLSTDVIFDILSRLLMKSVTRFKCVSKAWRSLISETVFIKCNRKCVGVKRSIFVFDSNKSF